jgi:hypothetical protein
MVQIASHRTYTVEASASEVIKAASVLAEYCSLATLFNALQTAKEPNDVVIIPCVDDVQAYNVAWTLEIARPRVETVDSMSSEREGTKYRVRSLVKGHWECECGDFQHRHNTDCKHIRYVCQQLHDRIMDQIRNP